jgi:secreted trypsin-like serine protease
MRKRCFGFASLVGGSALLVAAPPPAAAIVGGTDATQTYGFMASMQSTSGGQQCGATLIAAQWLVTAGHCVSDPATLGPGDPAKFQFRIGSTDRTQGGELAKADKFIRHEGWDIQLHNDIGLVHLSGPVHARPIALGTSPPPGAEIRELGWGSTCGHHGCDDYPVTLQQLDTTVADPAGCTVPDFDSARQLCVDNKGGTANACSGDSGGPAVVAGYGRWLLVGATSHGQSSPCEAQPGVYTNVPFYADWIAANTTPGGVG